MTQQTSTPKRNSTQQEERKAGPLRCEWPNCAWSSCPFSSFTTRVPRPEPDVTGRYCTVLFQYLNERVGLDLESKHMRTRSCDSPNVKCRSSATLLVNESRPANRSSVRRLLQFNDDSYVQQRNNSASLNVRFCNRCGTYVPMQFAEQHEREAHSTSSTRLHVTVLDKPGGTITPLISPKSTSVLFLSGTSKVGVSPRQHDEHMKHWLVQVQAHSRAFLSRRRCKQRRIERFAATWYSTANSEHELRQVKNALSKAENDARSDKLDARFIQLETALTEERGQLESVRRSLEQEAKERGSLQCKLYETLERAERLEKHMHSKETSNLGSDIVDGDNGEELHDYRDQCSQLNRTVDQLRKQLTDSRADWDEELVIARRAFERRAREIEAERAEAQAEALAQREKAVRAEADLQQLRTACEELRTAQRDAERAAHRIDVELISAREQLRVERELRERLNRDHLDALDRNRKLEADLNSNRLQLERTVSNMVSPTATATRFSSQSSLIASPTAISELESLRALVAQLERRIRELESELDKAQAHAQRLEQTKVRLELGYEKQKQQFQKDLAEKDIELADAQASVNKRIKQLEAQIEEDQSEKQRLIRERRETERQVVEFINEATPKRDRDSDKQRLLRELKRVRVQLNDSLEQCEALRMQSDSVVKQVGRDLKRKLEELEAENACLIRARQAREADLEELESRLVDSSRHEAEVRSKLDAAVMERSDVQSALEDREVELQCLSTRYKTVLQQSGIDQQTIAQLNEQNGELQAEVERLRTTVSEYRERVEMVELEKTDKSELLKYEARVRDAERQHQVERTSRIRTETQLDRLRDQIVALEAAKQNALDQLEMELEKSKKVGKQLRELREAQSELQHRFDDTERRKHDLQIRLDSLELDYEQAQSDLRLAFRRIGDLQSLLDQDAADDDAENENENDYADYAIEDDGSFAHDTDGDLELVDCPSEHADKESFGFKNEETAYETNGKSP